MAQGMAMTARIELYHGNDRHPHILSVYRLGELVLVASAFGDEIISVVRDKLLDGRQPDPDSGADAHHCTLWSITDDEYTNMPRLLASHGIACKIKSDGQV